MEHVGIFCITIVFVSARGKSPPEVQNTRIPDNMELDLASARPSLQSCVRDINALCEKSSDTFSRLVMHTLRESSGDSFPEQRHLIPGLQFLLGSGTKNKVSAEDFSAQLRAHTDLSAVAIDTMSQCYGAQNGGDRLNKVLGLGKFIGMDWKVGVAVQSSNCDNLCVPYVSMVVRISKSGIVEAHSMELSMQEFGDFATSVKEMQSAMEGL